MANGLLTFGWERSNSASSLSLILFSRSSTLRKIALNLTFHLVRQICLRFVWMSTQISAQGDDFANKSLERSNYFRSPGSAGLDN